MRLGRNGLLIVDKTDECANCKYFTEGITCALLEAVADKAVFLSQPVINVTNCVQFKEANEDEDAPKIKRIK
jgi:hypothetical protein